MHAAHRGVFPLQTSATNDTRNLLELRRSGFECRVPANSPPRSTLDMIEPFTRKPSRLRFALRLPTARHSMSQNRVTKAPQTPPRRPAIGVAYLASSSSRQPGLILGIIVDRIHLREAARKLTKLPNFWVLRKPHAVRKPHASTLGDGRSRNRELSLLCPLLEVKQLRSSLLGDYASLKKTVLYVWSLPCLKYDLVWIQRSEVARRSDCVALNVPPLCELDKASQKTSWYVPVWSPEITVNK